MRATGGIPASGRIDAIVPPRVLRVDRLPMISPAKTLLAVMLLLSAAVLGMARPAAAATPCWKALLNDWYDGRIDHTYAIHCYTDALKHLPPDVSQYSSAHDDIERALQSAIAAKTKAG